MKRGPHRPLAGTLFSTLILVIVLAACSDLSETSLDSGSTVDALFTWNLPDGVPLPVEPEDNPMSQARFELGRHLFTTLDSQATRHSPAAVATYPKKPSRTVLPCRRGFDR